MGLGLSYSMKNILFVLVVFCSIMLVGCAPQSVSEQLVGDTMAASHSNENKQTAIFAGGCFWCIESAFEDMDGVYASVSGYTGGSKETATYEQVSSGTTEHYEAVEISYNPDNVTYEELLDTFWRQIDPTDPDGQFADRGPHYRTAIFYANDAQKAAAEKSFAEVAKKFDKPIATKILPVSEFYMAEEYHQDYAKKKILQYKTYKTLSGRAGYIKETWNEE